MLTITERTELIGMLGAWVLQHACSEHAGWLRTRPDLSLDLAVNLSPRQIDDPTLQSLVGGILSSTSTGTPADRLVLDLTETLFVADTDRTIATLTELVGSGIGLAIDDFGAGWSSLRYLDRFPLEMLKIDQHFVSRLTDVGSNVKLLAGIASIAHDLGLTVDRGGRGDPGTTRTHGHDRLRPSPATSTVNRRRRRSSNSTSTISNSGVRCLSGDM